MITINLTHLGPDEQRTARYLSALANYRAAVAAQFAADLAEHGRQASTSAVDAARAELTRWEPTPAERARPVREVAEETGVAARTIRRWAERQVWAEQRGKLWYVDPDDVQRMSEMEPRRGWPLGKPRK